MIKYLVSAVLGALICAAAFTSPAAAQVGVGIDIGGGRDRYYDDRYEGDRYNRPGVRVYSGRSAYEDDCYTRRTTRWVNGRRVVRDVRVCDEN